MYRDYKCAEINEKLVGKTIKVNFANRRARR